MAASHRIDELGLRITTETAGHDAELRHAAEELTRAVLARMADLLETRTPGRVIRLRSLPIRWRLGEGAITGDADLEQLAAALARDLERRLPAPSDRPDPAGDAAVFTDEAHHLAASLASRARGEHAWYHAAESLVAEPLAALAMPDRAEVSRAVLADLVRMAAIEAVLSAATPAVLVRLAACLGITVDVRAAPPTAAAPVFRSVPDAFDRPTLVRALTRHAEAQARAVAAPFAAVGPPAWPGAIPSASVAAAANELDAASLVRPDLGRDPPPAPLGAAPATSRAAAAGDRDAIAGAEPGARPGSRAADPEPRRIATEHAGLFYLLNPIRELDVPETLWRACLPEGQILGHAAAALLGDQRDDPAPAFLAGAPLDRTFPEVSADQHAEIATAVVAALAQAFPRRGLAEIPAVEISLAGTGPHRLLIACARGSQFAMFAWPAATGNDAARGLAAFLGAWPAAAPIVGHGAVAALDPLGRVRPIAAPGPAPFVPGAPSPPAAALLAQVLGAPCQLVAARIDSDEPTAAALRSRLAVPGAIVERGDRLEVHLTPDAVDLAIRGAGLDRDPGWCAWLERDVRIFFIR